MRDRINATFAHLGIRERKRGAGDIKIAHREYLRPWAASAGNLRQENRLDTRMEACTSAVDGAPAHARHPCPARSLMGPNSLAGALLRVSGEDGIGKRSKHGVEDLADPDSC